MGRHGVECKCGTEQQCGMIHILLVADPGWLRQALALIISREPDFTVGAGEGPGVYWVEIRSSDRPDAVSWVRSNPVYVRDPAGQVRAAVRPPATVTQALFDGTSLAGWKKLGGGWDASSLAAIQVHAHRKDIIAP